MLNRCKCHFAIAGAIIQSATENSSSEDINTKKRVHHDKYQHENTEKRCQRDGSSSSWVFPYHFMCEPRLLNGVVYEVVHAIWIMNEYLIRIIMKWGNFQWPDLLRHETENENGFYLFDGLNGLQPIYFWFRPPNPKYNILAYIFLRYAGLCEMNLPWNFLGQGKSQ